MKFLGECDLKSLLLLLLLLISYFIDGTNNGVTPNPDIMCNQRIKFGTFHSLIINKYKMDAMATGHYAQLSTNEQGK